MIVASDEKFLDEGIEDSNGNSAGVVIHPISCNFLPSHLHVITNDQYDSVTVTLDFFEKGEKLPLVGDHILNSESKKNSKKVDKDKANSKRKKDTESGVSRGIDFQFVSNIINFDFPIDSDSYIHR